MKILLCTRSLGYGGAEKNIILLANSFCTRGHEVLVCDFGEDPKRQILDQNVRYLPLPTFEQKGIRRFRQLDCVKRLMKEERPDVVISFLVWPNVICSLAGVMTRTKVIVSERGDPTRLTGFVAKGLYSVNRLAKGIVFQTEGARLAAGRSMAKKSTVIPNPVVLPKESPRYDISKAGHSVAFSGRFEMRQKRQDLLVEAFRIVHSHHPDYKLVFYGDGPDMETVKGLVGEYHLGECVTFAGVSGAILTDIVKSELFVLCSDYEGIPNALMEAMAIGMPCVSTDCSPGGARYLIRDRENGLLVPCGDPQALAQAMEILIEDKDLAQRLGNEAVNIRERFSLETIISQWERYINEIISR